MPPKKKSTKPPEIPQRILDAAKQRRLIPFVGSGVSKQVSPSDFPSWSELLNILIEEAFVSKLLTQEEVAEMKKLTKENRHLLVAEELKSRLPRDQYFSLLQAQYSKSFKSKPSEAHKLLVGINPRLIITTNYDHLIEDSYASVRGRNLTVMKYSEADYVQRKLQGQEETKPFLFKIHGDIDDVSNVILSENDYRNLIFNERGYRSILSSLFLHYVVIFIGFSLDDPELLQTLQQIRHSLKEGNQPDYALCREGSFSAIEKKRFRKDFGIEIIDYQSTVDHKGLVNFLRALNRKVNI